MYLPEQGDPHSLHCGICGGARTTRFEHVTAPGYIDPQLTCVHACMRCDTDQFGKGCGPPLFAAEWVQGGSEGN
jgi:hypothetical protein